MSKIFLQPVFHLLSCFQALQELWNCRFTYHLQILKVHSLVIAWKIVNRKLAVINQSSILRFPYFGCSVNKEFTEKTQISGTFKQYAKPVYNVANDYTKEKGESTCVAANYENQY